MTIRYERWVDSPRKPQTIDPGKECAGRLEAMRDTFDEIWPSHADLPVSPDIIPALVQGAEKILRGEIPGTPEAFHGHDIRACDLGFTVLLCDP